MTPSASPLQQNLPQTPTCHQSPTTALQEETSYFLLNIALIAQQQGGDLTWLTPYWPALTQWIDFLVTLLPFPGQQ